MPTLAPLLAGLVRASHLLPSVAVTAFGTLLGVAAGLPAARAALLAAALLTGQLSIGWANDAADAGRDAAAGRTAKPVVAGLVPVRTLWWAATGAAVACVPLSLALGTLPGVLHLVAVGSAWAYDLALKGTPASPLPYLLSFGLLPVVAATAASRPAPWVLAVSAGVLGAAAHFANTVPDAAADSRTGVRGLPQRLGPRVSGWVAGAGVVTACALLLAGAPEGMPGGAVVLLGLAAGLGAAGAIGPGAAAFRVVLVAAALAVAGVVAAGPVLLR